MNFVEVGKLSTGFGLSQKNVFLGQEMQILKQLALTVTSSSFHQSPHNTLPRVVINCAKFYARTSSSFGVLTQRQYGAL